jgi:hypothetical protein
MTSLRRGRRSDDENVDVFPDVKRSRKLYCVKHLLDYGHTRYEA